MGRFEKRIKSASDTDVSTTSAVTEYLSQLPPSRSYRPVKPQSASVCAPWDELIIGRIDKETNVNFYKTVAKAIHASFPEKFNLLAHNTSQSDTDNDPIEETALYLRHQTSRSIAENKSEDYRAALASLISSSIESGDEDSRIHQGRLKKFARRFERENFTLFFLAAGNYHSAESIKTNKALLWYCRNHYICLSPFPKGLSGIFYVTSDLELKPVSIKKNIKKEDVASGSKSEPVSIESGTKEKIESYLTVFTEEDSKLFQAKARQVQTASFLSENPECVSVEYQEEHERLSQTFYQLEEEARRYFVSSEENTEALAALCQRRRQELKFKEEIATIDRNSHLDPADPEDFSRKILAIYYGVNQIPIEVFKIIPPSPLDWVTNLILLETELEKIKFNSRQPEYQSKLNEISEKIIKIQEEKERLFSSDKLPPCIGSLTQFLTQRKTTISGESADIQAANLVVFHTFPTLKTLEDSLDKLLSSQSDFLGRLYKIKDTIKGTSSFDSIRSTEKALLFSKQFHQLQYITLSKTEFENSFFDESGRPHPIPPALRETLPLGYFNEFPRSSDLGSFVGGYIIVGSIASPAIYFVTLKRELLPISIPDPRPLLRKIQENNFSSGGVVSQLTMDEINAFIFRQSGHCPLMHWHETLSTTNFMPEYSEAQRVDGEVSLVELQALNRFLQTECHLNLEVCTFSESTTGTAVADEKLHKYSVKKQLDAACPFYPTIKILKSRQQNEIGYQLIYATPNNNAKTQHHAQSSSSVVSKPTFIVASPPPSVVPTEAPKIIPQKSPWNIVKSEESKEKDTLSASRFFSIEKKETPSPALKKQASSQLGWNCFDIAIDLVEALRIDESDPEVEAKLAREELVKFALANTDGSFQRLLAPEIRHAAAITGTLASFDEVSEASRFALPLSLRTTPEVKKLLANYEAAHAKMNPIVADCSKLLGRNDKLSFEELTAFFSEYKEEKYQPLAELLEDTTREISPLVARCAEAISNPDIKNYKDLDSFFLECKNREGYAEAYRLYFRVKELRQKAVIVINQKLGNSGFYSLAELIDLFKTKEKENAKSYSNLAASFFSRYQEIFAPAENALQEFCLSRHVYETYVREYYGKNGWFAFQFDNGERTTSMANIAARLIDAEIIIEQKVGNDSVEIYRSDESKTKKKYILFDGVAHFIKHPDKTDTVTLGLKRK